MPDEQLRHTLVEQCVKRGGHSAQPGEQDMAMRLDHHLRALGLTASEGRKAMAWIAKSETADPKERLQGARVAFREWMISDRAAAVAWAGAFLEENGYVEWFDAVPGLVVASLAWKQPLEALEWADWISDPQQQELALITIARRWRRVDPEAAENWLATSPLSEEARQKSRENPVPFSGTDARSAAASAGLG